jgi:hypothetical protein
MAPVSFWEWFCAKYPPDDFIYNWQYYYTSIAAGANVANNPGNLNIQVPLFVFSFRSYAWVTATGLSPVFPYGIGIALLSGNDWTFGQWASQIVTGNGQAYDFPFAWPREVPATTQLTITVNNSFFPGSTPLTVNAGVVGLEPRQRQQSLRARPA